MRTFLLGRLGKKGPSEVHFFKKNDFYNYDYAKQTYKRLISLGLFNYVNISFDTISNNHLIGNIDGSWDGNVFTFVTPEPPSDTRTYDEKRKSEYPSIETLTVALWEAVVEERLASATALETDRQAIKAKYPKG